jgi:SAM-dependent methyltransferase
MLKKDVLNVQTVFVVIVNVHNMVKKIKPIRGYSDEKYISFANQSFSWRYIEKPTLIKLITGLVDKDTKILDAGCGEGRSINLLLDLGARDENITGVDLSQKLLDNLKTNLPQVNIVNLDFSKKFNSVFDNKFDLIISNMVVDYLDDKKLERAINNFYSWLSKKGTIIFGMPHPIREVVKIKDLSHYFDREEWVDNTPWGDKVEYHHRPVSDYVNLVIKNGFKLTELVEPEIDIGGMKDGENYVKYKSTPSRLFVVAKK